MPKQQEPGSTMPEFIRRQPAAASGVGKAVATPDIRNTLNGNGNGNHPPAMAADPMVEQASQGLEAINVLVNERNRMREENEFQRHRISDLEAKLANSEYYHDYYRNKSEHYERFSFSIRQQIATCVMIMNECQKKALDDGYNEYAPTAATPVPDAAPPVAPVPPQDPAEMLQEMEANRLRDLASQLERP